MTRRNDAACSFCELPDAEHDDVMREECAVLERWAYVQSHMPSRGGVCPTCGIHWSSHNPLATSRCIAALTGAPT